MRRVSSQVHTIHSRIDLNVPAFSMEDHSRSQTDATSSSLTGVDGVSGIGVGGSPLLG